MGKLILLLLVGLGAGFYFPASRAVLIEHGAPVLNPLLRWTTSGEMEKIAKDLKDHDLVFRQLPAPQQFESWLRDQYASDSHVRDSWGTPYQLRVAQDSFYVVSAGPDRSFGTLNDMAVGASWSGGNRRR